MCRNKIFILFFRFSLILSHLLGYVSNGTSALYVLSLEQTMFIMLFIKYFMAKTDWINICQ